MKPDGLLLLPEPRRAEWSGRWVRTGETVSCVEKGIGLGEEGYRLEIGEGSARIIGGGEAGVHWGRMTLEQVRRQSPEGMLPEGVVVDWPAFGVRGYYLDVSRGRVPRLDRLERKVEMLAGLKINRLYLYMEHVFRFAGDGRIAGEEDAFGADEVRELDAFCRERFVELVPSFSCFGHMGKILSLPGYRDLAEVEFPARDWASATWLQRLRGATLDAQSPRARMLLEGLLEELLPCFSSGRFHMCGDETHDLGKKRGVEDAGELGRLYARHVRWVAEVAGRQGKRVQLWGDVCRKYPGAAEALPDGAEVLDWAYFPSNRLDGGAFFAERGVPVAACPSVRGFGALFPAVEEAREVIVRQARAALECGAEGVVNTDWGDYGHFEMPPCAWHGIAAGAQAAWNPQGGGMERGGTFDKAFSRAFFGRGGEGAAAVFSRLGSVPPGLAVWPLAAAGGKPAGMAEAPPPLPPAECARWAEEAGECAEAFETLPDGTSPWCAALDRAQLALAARFVAFAARWGAGEAPGSLARELDGLARQFTELWLAESRPRGVLDVQSRGFGVLRQLLGERSV